MADSKKSKSNFVRSKSTASLKNAVPFHKSSDVVATRPSSSGDKKCDDNKIPKSNNMHRRSLSQGCILPGKSNGIPSNEDNLEKQSSGGKPSQEMIDEYFIAYMKHILTKKIRQDMDEDQQEIDKMEKELKFHRDRNESLKKILDTQKYLTRFSCQKLEVEKIDELVSFISNLKIECTEKNLQLSSGVEEKLCKLSQICFEIKEYQHASEHMEENVAKLKEKVQHLILLRKQFKKVINEAETVMMQYILAKNCENDSKSC